MSRELPDDSVRGHIRNWIKKHADLLGDEILEVGGRVHDPQAEWYINNRPLFPRATRYTVVDMQPGENVDVVADLSDNTLLIEYADDQYTGAICCEVLEHSSHPAQIVSNITHLVRPGGYVVITTPFGFHEHNYPHDYWRFTRQGMRLIVESCRMEVVDMVYAGNTVITVKNDDQPAFQKNLPMQLLTLARVKKCE